MKASSPPSARDFLYAIQRRKLARARAGQAAASFDERKNVLDLNILVLVDVSGSISPTQFKMFMRQIDSIKGLSRVKVIEVDTAIVAMYDYFTVNTSRIVRLGGGGGTEFSEAFKAARKISPDAMLFMTDGAVSGTVADPKIPVGWVLTKDGHRPYDFGTEIARLGREY